MTALLMAAADPAPAAGAAPPAPAPAAVAPPAAAKAKQPKKVCWQEMPTGSHFSKQICATPEELEQMEHNAQDALSDHARPHSGSGLGPTH
jgi:hypothetical protein